MTIGSDSFSFVTPYGTCSIEEMYEFVDKIGFTPVETITCATLNGAKMCHIEDETGSIEAGKCADLLVVNGDVAADIHVLNTDNMDVIMKDGWIVEAGILRGQQIQRLRYRLSMAGCKTQFLIGIMQWRGSLAALFIAMGAIEKRG